MSNIGPRIALGILAAALPARAAEVLQYDLRPGDHLVYRQTLEREVRNPETTSVVEVEWESHVVVLSEGGGRLHVGVQRNRRRAERTRGGQPQRLAEELERRPAAFAEAQWLTPTGQRELPFRGVREWTSRLLPFVYELEVLPDPLPSPGDRWVGGAPLGLAFRAEARETVGDEECLRFSGHSDVLALRYWFCPASRTLARLEYDGTYAVPKAEVRERLKVERIERRRGESVKVWLADPATREAALAALLLSPASDVGAETVYPLLALESTSLDRAVLALAWRKRWPPPTLPTLERLLRSESPRVRTLAARLLPAGDAAAASRRSAASDDDPFVRAAVEPLPAVGEPMLSLAAAVRSEAPIPDWRCGEERDWPSRAVAAQRARPQVAGATLRMMRTPPYAGLPYVAQVPEDYRGDEPFPVAIVLGGGAGIAVEAAQRMDRAFDATGYVVIYPQAAASWWEDPAPAAVTALLAEIRADFNVDPNRVYLTGMSNGGTGTFLYATLWPHRLAAAAPLMGAGVLLLGSRLPSLEGVAGLPLLFVHGSADGVIPVAGSADTVKAVRRADPEARVELHVLDGREHDVHVGSDDQRTLAWFARHARAPFPKRVRLRARDLAYARAFWVEVLDKDAGTAAVDAEIEGTTITIATSHVRKLRLLLRRELVPPGPIRVVLDGRAVFEGDQQEDCGLLARSWRASGDPFLAHSWETTLTVAKERR